MKKTPHVILHGGDYNPDQWLDRPDILARDVELMKEANINCVSMGIFAWSALEPEEGRYTFGWLDERINTLYENGIYTFLATPSAARPAWLDQAYPEAMRVAADGTRNHHGNRHNSCLSSPAYREKVRQIDTQLAKRYGRHPGVILWHISNEFSGECFCPLCAERFRSWLKDRYGTISALNHAWWTAFWSHTYTSFDQIEPPYTNGERSVEGLILDWKRFTTWNTADYLQMEADTLKQYAPDVPVTTNFHLTDSLNYAELAQPIDVISWDSYPFWHKPDDTLSHTAAVTGLVHSRMRGYKAGQPFLLMESAPGLVNWQPYNKIRRPGMHRLASLQAVASGSDSVCYFQIRKSRGSAEQFHGAVIDHTGTNETRIFSEVKELGADLKKLACLKGTRIHTKAAMLADRENSWALDLCQGFSRSRNYQETLDRHYEAFTAATGCDLDLISFGDDLSRYSLLILPMCYTLSEQEAARIRVFTEKGGTVFATYGLAYVDGSLLAHLGGFPGGGLKEVFGIWNEEVDSLYPGETNHTQYQGREYTIRDFCEVVHPRGAETLCTYGEDYYSGAPVLTRHRFGKGTAWYLAARTDDAFLRRLYSELAAEAGLPVQVLPESVEKHVRTDESDRYTFYLNFSTQTVEVTVPQGTDLLSGTSCGPVASLPPYGVICIKEAL